MKRKYQIVTIAGLLLGLSSCSTVADCVDCTAVGVKVLGGGTKVCKAEYEAQFKTGTAYTPWAVFSKGLIDYQHCK
jgi:hypothetical protein